MSYDDVLRLQTLAWPVTWRRVPTTPHREDRFLSNGLLLKYAICLPCTAYHFLYPFLVSLLAHNVFPPGTCKIVYSVLLFVLIWIVIYMLLLLSNFGVLQGLIGLFAFAFEAWLVPFDRRLRRAYTSNGGLRVRRNPAPRDPPHNDRRFCIPKRD